MMHLNFAAPAPKKSWRASVRDYLASLPADHWTPAQDLALVEGAARSPRIHRSYMETERLRVLLRCTRNEYGHVTIDGQAALLSALKDRA